MSKTTYPLMLIFSSLSTDYNYFDHSCYQSRISVHICQQLLCNKSEWSYYKKQSLAKRVLLSFAVNRLRSHNWLILTLISLPPLTLAPSSLLNSCWLETWWNRRLQQYWMCIQSSTNTTKQTESSLRAGSKSHVQSWGATCGWVHTHVHVHCPPAQLYTRQNHTQVGQPGWGD